MQQLETWLERVYRADGDHATLSALQDEWSSDYDQQLRASGNPYIAITAGFVGRGVTDFDATQRWRKLDQSRLFRTYPFSDSEAHLRHWVLACQKSGGNRGDPGKTFPNSPRIVRLAVFC